MGNLTSYTEEQKTFLYQRRKEALEEQAKYLKSLKEKLKSNNAGMYQFPNGRWVPEHFLSLFDKVYNGSASVVECIKANCIDCCYDSEGAGFATEQIERCEITSCPMYRVRNTKARALLKNAGTDSNHT